jgi:hypothetical protein
MMRERSIEHLDRQGKAPDLALLASIAVVSV